MVLDETWAITLRVISAVLIKKDPLNFLRPTFSSPRLMMLFSVLRIAFKGDLILFAAEQHCSKSSSPRSGVSPRGLNPVSV